MPNDSERDSEWGSWYVQEGVNPKKSTDREREIWKWVKTGTSWKTQKVADVPLNNEETCKELVWRTFFHRDPAREPLASEYPHTPAGSKDPPPPAPLTQEQMQELYDVSKLVARHPDDANCTNRKARKMWGWRKNRNLHMRRIFTQSFSGVIDSSRTCVRPDTTQ